MLISRQDAAGRMGRRPPTISVAAASKSLTLVEELSLRTRRVQPLVKQLARDCRAA